MYSLHPKILSTVDIIKFKVVKTSDINVPCAMASIGSLKSILFLKKKYRAVNLRTLR